MDDLPVVIGKLPAQQPQLLQALHGGSVLGGNTGKTSKMPPPEPAKDDRAPYLIRKLEEVTALHLNIVSLPGPWFNL